MAKATTLTCADCDKPMAQVRASLPQGKARCQPCRRIRPARKGTSRPGYIAPSHRGSCAVCGSFMHRGKTSQPQGQATCLPCRREAQGRSHTERLVLMRHETDLYPCKWCLTLFVRAKASRRYCTDECFTAHRKTRSFSRCSKPSKERGQRDQRYGAAHQRARRSYASLHNPTDPCARCGDPLGPMGPNLHLDHADDRVTYLGFSHAGCNIRDGARRGGRVARIGGGRCDSDLRIVQT